MKLMDTIRIKTKTVLENLINNTDWTALLKKIKLSDIAKSLKTGWGSYLIVILGIIFIVFGMYIILTVDRAEAFSSENSYSRDQFGGWVDSDSDGENTRQEVINKYKITVNGKDAWLCLYTGLIVLDSSKLDIDHIVPLRYAWYSGAMAWSDEKKSRFANDLDNLLPVYNYTNRSKGAKDPVEWIPPNISFCASYIDKFVQICNKYSLSCNLKKISDVFDVCQGMRKGIKVPNYQIRQRTEFEKALDTINDYESKFN